MTGDVTITRNTIGALVGSIAIVTFLWNATADYLEQKNRIEQLEYKLTLGEARDRELLLKVEKSVEALNQQRIAFERLRAVLDKKN